MDKITNKNIICKYKLRTIKISFYSIYQKKLYLKYNVK